MNATAIRSTLTYITFTLCAMQALPVLAKDWVLMPALGGHRAQANSRLMKPLGLESKSDIDALGAYLVQGGSKAPVAPAGFVVEEVRPVSALGEPNDPNFARQWNLQKVRAPQSWALSVSPARQLVAVVDTGIDDSHPDLNGQVDDGVNMVDGGDYVDDHGHGTFVASLIAAITNNGIGMAGMAVNTGLLAVKVLDAQGYGTDFGVAQGMVWAVDNGATVINLSLGTHYRSRLLEEAVAYAAAHNVLVVAASGNSGREEQIYPAAFDGVMTVGASTSTDQRASYSTFNASLDILAPGGDTSGGESGAILGAVPGAAYSYGSGTSFAAPQVAGAAALYRGLHPQASSTETLAAINATADPLSKANGWSQGTGWGRLNVARLLGSDVAPVVFQAEVTAGEIAAAGTLIQVAVGAAEPAQGALNPDPSQVSAVYAVVKDAEGNEVHRQGLTAVSARDFRSEFVVPSWNGLANRQLNVSFLAVDSSGNTSPALAWGELTQMAAGPQAPSTRGTEEKTFQAGLPRMMPLANPAPNICVRVQAEEAGMLELKIYDLAGSLVATRFESLQLGENRICLAESVANGTYFALGKQGQGSFDRVKLAIRK